MRQNKIKKMITMLLIVSLIAGIFPAGSHAAAAETATVRIISTTDLHGQLTNTNYDTAGKKATGSLAQDYTLIKAARKEIKYGTTVTVDAGDTIYGYGSDFIYENDGNEFMYSAMAKMGYDAITMGNHDFDYGYSYVKKQLKKSGLDKITVLSNVYDAVTGKQIWNENKLLTKTVTTDKGKKVNVKIGIIGVTRPQLTSYYNHKGVLTTQDILESTKEQVKKLKAKGADLIVVIAHSGIGTANPQTGQGDVSYALTKIDGVDAVMCGHAHLNYPSSDANVQKYYELPNVDKKTGLMNGKPVVMVADHAAGIGIADLKIQITNGKVSLVGQKAEIRYNTKKTVADPAILEFQKAYDELVGKTFGEEVGEISSKQAINNYFGLLEDNPAIQLVNEAKMQVGLNYINTQNKEYKDYPVIAVSTYKKYGAERDDYVNISGKVTMADVLSIQSYYHDFSYVYWITGKQLREWLEWTASAYETPGNGKNSGDELMDSYIKEMGMSSLIKKEWLADWSNFHMFDGVEYDIDITQPAKYSMKGDLLDSTASRISKLTCNGKEITDDMKMILVSEVVTARKAVIGSEVVNQRLYKSKEYSTNMLKDYLQNMSQFGNLPVSTDDNWRVLVPGAEDYIIRSGISSEDAAKDQQWYRETLGTGEDYAYYRGGFSERYTDISGPMLIASPTITLKTNKDIPVIVQANDASKVTSLRYAFGLFGAKDEIWSTGVSANISDNQFLATQNGTYTVFAMDTYGNATVKHIKINNLNRDVLQAPTVNRVTNKSKTVSGTADPEATITIKAGGATYTTTVAEDGTYECKIAFQKANKTVNVTQTGNDGKTSEAASFTVMRAGPNYPSLSSVTNKAAAITADINDVNSQIFALIGDTVYVAKDGGKKVYMLSNRYSKDYEIVETDYDRDGDKVSLAIPVQLAGTPITVCAVDYIGRVNYPISTKVKEVAPEMPVLYTSCDSERYIFGYVPNPGSEPYEIKVTVGSKVYSGSSDINGCFKIETGSLTAGETVFATATDVVKEKTRESAAGSRQVRVSSFYALPESKASVVFLPMTDKEQIIRGTVNGFEKTLYVKAGGEYYDLEIEPGVNSFEIPLAGPLKAGDTVSAVVRSTFGNVKETSIMTVTMALPDKPELVNEAIYTTTKTVKILSAEKCNARVKVGKTVYTAKTGVLNQETGIYTYKVTIEKPKKGQKVYIYMENAAGKSKRIATTVEEKE